MTEQEARRRLRGEHAVWRAEVSALVGWVAVPGALYLPVEALLRFVWKCQLFNMHSSTALVTLLLVPGAFAWIIIHTVLLVLPYRYDMRPPTSAWYSWTVAALAFLVGLILGIPAAHIRSEGSCF